MSLLQGPQPDNGCVLPAFVKWYKDNQLDLNVTKTKKFIIDFRKDEPKPKAIVIHFQEVEIVNSYKYLGTIFNSQLMFDTNTESTVKRGQQRNHLMRRLNSCNVSKNILCDFYHSFIKSLLTFSFICWFNELSLKDKNSLNRVVKVSEQFVLMPSGKRCYVPPEEN